MRHLACTSAVWLTAALIGLVPALPTQADPPALDGTAPELGAKPAGARGPARVAFDVRVVSLNVWAIPLVSKQLDARLRRLPAALRAQRADILCLQELWTGGHQRRIARAMARSHPHAAYGDGGLLTLSRQPLHGKRFTSYPSTPGLSLTERLAGKGYLETVHRIRGVAFRVINTHLAFAPGADSPRVRQLGHLERVLGKRHDAPVLLVGDLNTASVTTSGPNPELRFLHRAGFVDANPPRPLSALNGTVAVRSTRMGWPREGDAVGFGWDPDHILARGTPGWRLACVRFDQALDTARTALSDHDLIAATWRFTPAAPPR